MSETIAAHWLTLHGLIAAVAVLLYVITSHAIRPRRQPAAAIGWVLFMMFVPYLALPAFLTFGLRKLRRARASPSQRTPPSPGGASWAIETILALNQPAPAQYQNLAVHNDGVEARDALLNIIDGAQTSLDLCTFILAGDAFGDMVFERLCRAARRGVRVRVMLDGLGKLMGGRHNLRPLTDAGITVAVFDPPVRSFFKGGANLRDHRKLAISDSGRETARMWCGGRNLAAEYFTGKADAKPWIDLSFDVQGDLVAQAHALFVHDWNYATGESDVAQLPTTTPPIPQDGAQLVASGPDQEDDTVYTLLITAAYRAQRRIALVTPYFVPDAALLTALCIAARRGIAVDLILPERSNHRLSDLARDRALRALVQAGGKVWLLPEMIHAKLIVIDETLALAGSANLDSRSLFLNFELMVAFHKPDDVKRYAEWFDRHHRTTRCYVARPPGLLRDIAEGMLLWTAFQL